jgi:hypothetical protein
VTLTLATPDQLRARLQSPGLDDTTAARAIADASALVRAVAGQSFDYVENDTVELAGNGYDLILPQRPLVVDVSHPVTVTERRYGTIFSPTLLEGYIYRRIGGVLRRYYRPWADTVRVTYTHGFHVTVPDWLTSLVLDAAMMYATNPQGLRSETVGGITQVWARESITNASDTVAELVKGRLKLLGWWNDAFMIRPLP